MTAPTYDCRTCGACCVSDLGPDVPHYIPLTEKDLERFDAATKKRLVVLDSTGLPALGVKPESVKSDRTVCQLHAGVIGVRSRCALYGKRPDICRGFEPGSRACRIARRDEGLDP